MGFLGSLEKMKSSLDTLELGEEDLAKIHGGNAAHYHPAGIA